MSEDKTTVLFVCRANRNRSPAAEYIARTIINKLGIEDIAVSSAGLHEVRDYGMAPEMKHALTKLGYSTEANHTPRPITRKDLSHQDLILTFHESQRNRLLSIDPEAVGKVFTLDHYARGASYGIDDPNDQLVKLPRPLHRLPGSLVYRILGIADRRNRSGVLAVHYDIAKEIEGYVVNVIDRVSRERNPVKKVAVHSHQT